MKCGKCGLDLKGENTYCPNCGTKLRNKDEQFGANASKSKDHENNESKQNFKERFGASSSSVRNDNEQGNTERNFGAKNNENTQNIRNKRFGASSTNTSSGFISNVLNIFKLDDKNEWIKRYLIAITFFIIYVYFMHIWINKYILILNVILFPLIICVYDHIIRKIIAKSSYSSDIVNLGCAFATIKLIIKYLILLIIWNYSWIVGIFAFIYLYFVAKKLG